MKVIKPKPLKPGDILGIVACSTPIVASSDGTTARAYQRVKNNGFKLVEAPNCRKVRGHAVGTAKERVKAFRDCFRDPKVDGMLHFRGGCQADQLLEYLDCSLFRKIHKPFIGYGDTT